MAMEITLTPRKNARGSAKQLRLKHARFLDFGDVFFYFL